jgi:hypothetical protein
MQESFTRVVALLVAAGGISGCAMTSPYWSQHFPTKGDFIPVTVWAVNAGSVKIQCHQANHGGLYPLGQPPEEGWVDATNLFAVGTSATYDSLSTPVFPVSSRVRLPDACWYEDPAYPTSTYLTAIRAEGPGSGTTRLFYYTYTKEGLECLGGKVGAGQNWLAGLGCENTYSNSSDYVPYVIIIAGPDSIVGSTSTLFRYRTPAARFLSEPRDDRASSTEHRLRASFGALELTRSQISSVECRQSLCRVTVTHADRSALRAFAVAATGHGFSLGQGNAIGLDEQRSGSIEATYFIDQGAVRDALSGLETK